MLCYRERAVPRVTRENWIEAGLKLLQSKGSAALTIDGLCAVMGKTKGSFYHHFGDAAGLRRALLDNWEARQTSAIIDVADLEGDLRRRAAVLDEMVVAADWGEERAIRTWAWQDPKVRERVDAVDRRRVEYLASFYDGPPRQAHQFALIEYAALVGAQHLFLVGAGRARDETLGKSLRDALRQAAGDKDRPR